MLSRPPLTNAGNQLDKPSVDVIAVVVIPTLGMPIAVHSDPAKELIPTTGSLNTLPSRMVESMSSMSKTVRLSIWMLATTVVMSGPWMILSVRV